MKIYVYIILCAALIAIGWFYRGEHDAKELANAIQESEQRHQTQRTGQEKERLVLENQLAQDRQKSSKRLQLALNENVRLREDAARPVPVELLIFARLCNDPDECSLLGFTGTDKAPPPTQRPVTAVEVYSLLQSLDTSIIAHNLGLSQLEKQLLACQGR